MAQFEFKLPDIGEGVVEGEIVKWLVKAGDEIIEDQPLVEVMTDKATVTIPSPRKGKVVKTVGKEGEIARVHGTLVVLEVGGTGPDTASHGQPTERPSSAVPAQAAPSLPASQAGQPAPLQSAHAPKPGADPSQPGAQTQRPGAQAQQRGAQVQQQGAQAQQQAQAEEHDGQNGDGRRVLATPVTRRMARELGVDLSQLQGSGPQGRVMKADLVAHAERPPPQQQQRAPAPPVQASEADEVRPLRGLRKSISKGMVQSHNHVVPFTFVEECDTARLTQLRERVNADLAKRGDPKLSYLPFLTKALLRGFRKYPDLNAVMDEEKQALIVRKEFNIGFGAATESGLTVFVVKDVAHKSIRQLGAEIDRLGKAAREQKLQLPDLQGSTFTVTSLGKDGGLFATPVVKHPEVAILGVHKIKQLPVVENGQIVIGERMNLSCSFDHRVIDGHIGAAFLYEVIRALEAPETLLVE